MSRLIFLNLAIDQLWDPQNNLASLFPARIPESEHLVRLNENLGIFLSNLGDQVLAYQKTAGFHEFLAERNSDFGNLIEISKHPFDQSHWLKETLRQLQGTSKFSALVSASLSSLEEALLAQPSLNFQTHPALSAESLATWNRKTFLLKLCQELTIPVPPTEVLSQKNLVQGAHRKFLEPHLLKHDFGSGGAANFVVQNSKDPNFTMLQRRLDPKSSSQWLLQKQIPSAFEGSVFGWGSEPPETAEVSYSPQGLSYRHQFAVDSKIHAQATSIYEKIQAAIAGRGYQGPIGLDFLISKETGEFFAIDLNLRLTKTHVLERALQKLNLDPKKNISLRHRWKSAEPLKFTSWWQKCRQAFILDRKGENSEGHSLIPYSVAGLESPGSLKEISVFISREGEDAAKLKMVDL